MTDRDRLIELFKKTEYTPFPEMTMTANLGNQFTDYGLNCIVDNLLANGVIVPPCKVGQTVYYISFRKVYKGKCHAITIQKNSVQIHLYDYDGDNASCSAKDIFLTKEEAEEKLKELNNNA